MIQLNTNTWPCLKTAVSDEEEGAGVGIRVFPEAKGSVKSEH